MLPQDSQYRQWESIEKMVYLIAGRVNRRVEDAGLSARVSLDDLVQEGSAIWLTAMQSFDPDYGVKFPTYLYRSLWNCLNRYVDKQGYKRGKATHYHVSLDDDESPLNLLCENINNDPQLALEGEQALSKVIDGLSPKARVIFAWMIDTPPWLQEEIDASRCYARELVTRQYRMRAPGVQDLPLIARILRTVWGINQDECRDLTREVRGVLR